MSIKMGHNKQQLWLSGTSTEIQAALRRLLLKMGTDVRLVDALQYSCTDYQLRSSAPQSAPVSLRSV
ncbi:hypothetical protein [Paenibacillus taiwanensis]|uniref:hypothetical protein n=1 Tax=Paenibacillus taiwanensis TaxID=401638 RepID=UPI0004921CE9|nr:hypothetical protein [Paenibacillus taiwanensis]